MIEEERRMRHLYGDYTDSQPCLPPSTDGSHLQLRSSIDVRDQIAIRSKITEAQSKEEQAKEIARHYQDCCSQLEVLKVKSEMAQLNAKCNHEKKSNTMILLVE